MTLIAGLDVGNSTTEVVISETTAGGVATPVAWDRVPTRGAKGSGASWEHAARVLGRLERRSGRAVDVVAVTRQTPVETSTVTLHEPPVDTGPLRVVGRLSRSPGRAGFGVGRPADLSGEPPGPGPVVAVAEAGLGYRTVVSRLADWVARGVEVVAVALEGDDAVVVGNRWDRPVPIADEVDAGLALAADRLAVEVAPVGHLITRLADPVRLAAVLGPLSDAAATGTAGLISGRRSAVVARWPGATPVAVEADRPWADLASGMLAVPLADALRAVAAGADRIVRWHREGRVAEVADLFGIDLALAAAAVWARPGVGGAVISTLSADRHSATVDPTAYLAGHRAEVVAVSSEEAAARAGALTTPGALSSALVLDVGGGTIDAVPAQGPTCTVAGAGELLTLAVANVLGIPVGAADWVKRGPAARLEGPHLLVDESGERSFLASPANADAVGSLVVEGPAGLLPFHRRLAAAEWRALRLRLKSAVLGANVARSIRDISDAELIVVGGPAGDEELLQALGAVLGGRVIGRGDVAGRLGNRWAVAFGLTLLAGT